MKCIVKNINGQNGYCDYQCGVTPAISTQHEKPLNNCRYTFPSKVKQNDAWTGIETQSDNPNHCPGDVGLLIGPVRNSGGTFGTRGEFAV
jgi:hypothetical protein